MIAFLLASLLVLLGGGLGALVIPDPKSARLVGVGGAVLGGVLGLVPAIAVLAGSAPLTFAIPWRVPAGTLALHLDALAALFLVPTLALPTLCSVYGASYLHGDDRKVRTAWFFYDALAAAMALLLVAANGILFLMAWEGMALTSFFLVTYDDDRADVREAGWIYLVAAHLGGACLLALFAILGHGASTLDFSSFVLPTAGPAGVLAFVLAVVGFGAKAGFVPLHVWLPEAHPAAPSHVSAVMSGVMIATGAYGLVRILSLAEAPPVWWGWTLLAIGAVTGVLGALFALAQRDLKRLLAYSSVENLGIVTLGLGIGYIGLHAGSVPVAALGFGAAFLHVLNHAVFKGLLFLGAGSVAHATGTREFDSLGGLARKMPLTAATFLVGSAAICGLPPFNGFIGEFLLYLGALHGSGRLAFFGATLCVAAIATLALIGGLAAAAMAKSFGAAFLGEPRSAAGSAAHDPGPAMTVPMLVLAALCLTIGLAAPLLPTLLAGAIAAASGLPADAVASQLSLATAPLGPLVAGVTIAMALTAALLGLRYRLLARRPVGQAGTWDCGYARPTARMQYTGAAFVEPLTTLFAGLLRTERHVEPVEGLLPGRARFETEPHDVFRDAIFRPAFRAIRKALNSLRWIQHGNVQLYVLYIALTLLVLLVWKLG